MQVTIVDHLSGWSDPSEIMVMDMEVIPREGEYIRLTLGEILAFLKVRSVEWHLDTRDYVTCGEHRHEIVLRVAGADQTTSDYLQNALREKMKQNEQS